MKKRILCFTLLFVLVFSVCACKDSKKEDTKGVDVEYYANLGQIPECEYSIGKKSDDIISELEKKEKNSSSDEDSFESDSGYYYLNEQEDKTVISTSNCDYICDSKTKNEVTKIVCFGKSYGFENGAVSIEVKDALSSYGFDAEEKSVTENEENLFKIGSDCTCLEYKFEKATVVFAFQDNALLGAAIYK